MNDVVAEIPSCWEQFGLCLGVDSEKLTAIDVQNHHKQWKCFADVYLIWKKEKCRPLTWNVVVDILEKKLLKNERLAHQLKKKYGVS